MGIQVSILQSFHDIFAASKLCVYFNEGDVRICQLCKNNVANYLTTNLQNSDLWLKCWPKIPPLPTFVELREYALGESGPDICQRIEKILEGITKFANQTLTAPKVLKVSLNKLQ